MTDIIPLPNWSPVRQLETNEYATGGLNGNMNEQAKSLAGQNMYSRLYAGLPFDPVFTAQIGGFPIGGRAALENGDIVKSTIADNTANPNVDMTGWVNPEVNQQIFNDKYSKFKQPEAGAIERDLSVRSRDIQYGADYSTLQNAVDAQRFATSDITLGIKTYTLAAPLNIKGYAYIKGSGFYSDLKFSGAGNGIVYTGTGLQDDHGQRKLSDFQIRGDNTVGGYLGVKTGTTIGYQHTNTGHFSETNGLLLNGHATGLKIENGYTNRNIYNYYRANKVGLHLKNVTSHREESIYARYNDEAGVLIEGTVQNITIAGGAIEGNHGRGLWAKNLTAESFPKIVLDDVYFESDGDKAAGVPAIDIQEHPRLHVDVRAGSYWNNVLSGITTGIYKWGNSVSFNGTTLNGFHYAKRMRVKDCVDYAIYNSDLFPTESIANGLVEPVMMLEYSPNFRVSGFGIIFQVPLAGRPTRKLLAANEATLAYPHILSKSASTITTENTALNYGDGSWTDIAFSASGDYSNNFAQLTNLIDATSEYISKVCVFLLKPTADCQIGIVATGTVGTHQNYFQLKAGVTYRMCCFANRSASGDYRMRLFSTNGAATIAYLPIYLAKFKTTQEGINFTNMFATGAL